MNTPKTKTISIAGLTFQFKLVNGGRGIEWCDLTWNTVGGCEHECRWEMPDGEIAICYAEDLAENRLAQGGYPHGFKHHYWRPNILGAPLKVKEPSFIFCDSMSDLMGHWVPEDQVLQVLDMMRKADRHIFQLLTKNPPRLMKFIDHLPPNVWVGVSSPPDFFKGKPMPHNAQVRYVERAMDILRAVGEKVPVVWMSIEPLSWDIAPYLKSHPLKWAVIGAASNGAKKYQPNPDHVQAALDVLDATNTPVFFKGNLKWYPRREDFPVRGPIGPVLRRQQMALEHGWPLNRFLLEEKAAAVSISLVSGPATQTSLFAF